MPRASGGGTAPTVRLRALRDALWLLRDLTLPYLRRHRLRTILTLAGVVIGTQVVVAVRLIDRSVVASFAHTIDTLAGNAALQVSDPGAGVPEALIAPVAAAPGVDGAAGLVEGTLTTAWGELAVFGVDVLGDQRVRETQFPREHVHLEDELAFVNAPDSIALSTSFLARSGLERGGRLAAVGPLGRVSLVVRGTLDPEGPAALFGGAVGLVDLPTAQRLLGRAGLVDQIDVTLRPGATAAEVAAALEPIVGGAGSVHTPHERAIGLGTMLENFEFVLTLAGAFTVMVSFFLVYHTLRTAILHRRREFAIVRAVGFRTSALGIAMAMEAVGFGVVGALLGAPLGVAAANAALEVVAGAVGALYQRLEHAALAPAPSDFLLAGAVGVLTALVAAAGPARDAARTPVLASLGTGREDSEHRWLALAGVALCAATVAFTRVDIRAAGMWGQVVVIGAIVVLAIGYALLVPEVIRLLLEPLERRRRRGLGVSTGLAVASVRRRAGRLRSTVSATMVAFALVLSTNSMVRSMQRTILAWIDDALSADLYVSRTPDLPLPASPTLAGDLDGTLRATPGIEAVVSTRVTTVRVNGRMAVLRSIDAAALGHWRLHETESVGSTYRERFAAGDAVLVSDNLAHLERLHAGDTLVLPTPAGTRRFAIAAVVPDYTLDIGTVMIDSATYRRLWSDPLVTSYLVWLAPGAQATDVAPEIRRRLGDGVPLAILSAREFKSGIATVLANALRLSYAVALVGILVATIGVVNFFLVEVADRSREIGLLRSVALDGGQLRRMLLAEACIIGLLGGILAWLYGWPASYLTTVWGPRLGTGWRIVLDFPVALALAVVLLSAATATAAAMLPLRRLGRVPVGTLVGIE